MGKINIQVSRETHRKLEEEGRKGQTFNDIVNEAVNALHNEKIYNSYYFHYRDSNKMDLQYGEVSLPKGGKHIKIHIEDVVSAIHSICEETDCEVEIIGNYTGKPESSDDESWV